MGFFVADQDNIAPRPCATTPPNFPAFPHPIDDAGTITTPDFGLQPNNIVPYAFNGTVPTGGTETQFRNTGGRLESHPSGGLPRAWPVQNGNYQPAVYDQGTFSHLAYAGGGSFGIPVEFTSSLALLINGSETPAGITPGDTVTATGTLTLTQPMQPSGGPNFHTELAAISVVDPSSVNHALGDAILTQVGSTNEYTYSLPAPDAGVSPFTVRGNYTFKATYPGDQVNGSVTSNQVTLYITIS
jgi:hypothetical protein